MLVKRVFIFGQQCPRCAGSDDKAGVHLCFLGGTFFDRQNKRGDALVYEGPILVHTDRA